MNSLFSFSRLTLVCIVASQGVSAFQSSNRVFSKSIRPSGLLASPDVIELQDSNFRDFFSSDTPILIDACAEFCGPCKLIEPVIDQVASNRKDSLVVSRYDVESDSNEIKLELLFQRVMPRALPSLILIQNNKVLGTKTGLISADALDEFLDARLGQTVAEVGIDQRNEDQAKRIKRKGFISFMYQQDDYMLKGNQL
ncbi:MAG: hypothetical protein SGBAC_003892 [Bacillariaceae sp.]